MLTLHTADIISAVEFDKTGEHLATGDRGGRVVLFERLHPSKATLVSCDKFFWHEQKSLSFASISRSEREWGDRGSRSPLALIPYAPHFALLMAMQRLPLVLRGVGWSQRANGLLADVKDRVFFFWFLQFWFFGWFSTYHSPLPSPY